MSGKSSQGFQWTDEKIQVLLEVTQNLEIEENYEITRFYPIPTVIYVPGVFTLFLFIKNFHFFIKHY